MSNEKVGEALDTMAAEKAFESLKSELLAIGADQLVSRSLDRKRAALVAWRVARDLKESSLRKRLTSLPKSEFDATQLTTLEPAALALWHTTVSAQSAAAQSTDARLPAPLVEDALAVKYRMLALVQYHFSDDPLDGAEIADIVVGNGYLDLATDLQRLAKLYEKHANAVKRDTKHYVAGDAKEARKLSQQILKTLGDQQSADATKWADLEVRALTYLVRVYDDIALTIRWIQRNDTTGDVFSMPVLYSASRRAKGGSKPSPDPEPTEPTESTAVM